MALFPQQAARTPPHRRRYRLVNQGWFTGARRAEGRLRTSSQDCLKWYNREEYIDNVNADYRMIV
jgi:hypothetical protein